MYIVAVTVENILEKSLLRTCTQLHNICLTHKEVYYYIFSEPQFSLDPAMRIDMLQTKQQNGYYTYYIIYAVDSTCVQLEITYLACVKSNS